MNKVILVGRLGLDPEIKYTHGGIPVANLSVATDESYRDASGKRINKTEWHKVVVWGLFAETCAQHLEKGHQVSIEGSLATRSWDKNGEKRYSTEIKASKVEFLNKTSSAGKSKEKTQPEFDYNIETGEMLNDSNFVADDIPF